MLNQPPHAPADTAQQRERQSAEDGRRDQRARHGAGDSIAVHVSCPPAPCRGRVPALAVMAAAGLDTFDQPLPQKRITLPNEGQLLAIKRQTGFESIATLRENYAPI